MEHRPDPAHRCIIVIDHNDDSRLILSDQLRAMGYEVHAEDNGVSGLARLAGELSEGHPLGLIVELDMPVLGGMAIVQEVRDRHPDLPLIIMAHSEGLSRLRRALQIGANEYLIKPFSFELLKRKCQQVFQPKNGIA